MSNERKKTTLWARKYGPWALVTGASDGIGRAMATDLARRGVNVLLAARRRDMLETAADEIAGRYSVETRICAADLGTQEGVAEALAAAEDIDIGLFAACAGFGTSGDMLSTELSDELNMIDVNCRAVFAMVKPLAARFAEQGRGGIVLMGSLVGFQGVPYAANYAATKAYAQTLAEGLRVELADKGVDVVSSAPGPVASGFAARAGMTMGQAAAPRRVARETLNALGAKTTVRPGLQSKILGLSLGMLPRSFRTSIMTGVMRNMTHPQNADDKTKRG